MKQTGHIKAPGNWINDPNGFIYYRGRYHVFYQHFPYEPRWGTMHWGHAVSTDLIHWEHLPIALYPTKPQDRNGCFSGSAVEHDGKLYLFYTGVRYHQENPENIHKHVDNDFESCQMLMVSDDGEHFDNLNAKRVIIPKITDPEVGDVTHTRDPKVWRGSDAWYMVLGSTRHGEGELLIYRSRDLTTWELAGQAERPGIGWMWECPDWFTVDGHGVLLFSPMGYMKDCACPPDMSLCAFADFDEKTCTLHMADNGRFFDYGLDLYAPQSTLDAEGRRIVIAWLRMPGPVDKGIRPWWGMMCLPRVVSVRDGRVRFSVHPDVRAAYARPIATPSEAGNGGFRMTLELHDGEVLDIGGYRIARAGGRLRADRSAVCPHNGKCRLVSETPEIREGDHLEIYVDGNIVETYVNDGERTLTHAVYGLSDDVHLEGSGPIALYALGKKCLSPFSR